MCAASCLNWEIMKLFGWQDMVANLSPKAGGELPISSAFGRHEVFVQGSNSKVCLVIVKVFRDN